MDDLRSIAGTLVRIVLLCCLQQLLAVQESRSVKAALKQLEIGFVGYAVNLVHLPLVSVFEASLMPVCVGKCLPCGCQGMSRDSHLLLPSLRRCSHSCAAEEERLLYALAAAWLCVPARKNTASVHYRMGPGITLQQGSVTIHI